MCKIFSGMKKCVFMYVHVHHIESYACQCTCMYTCTSIYNVDIGHCTRCIVYQLRMYIFSSGDDSMCCRVTRRASNRVRVASLPGQQEREEGREFEVVHTLTCAYIDNRGSGEGN